MERVESEEKGQQLNGVQREETFWFPTELFTPGQSLARNLSSGSWKERGIDRISYTRI